MQRDARVPQEFDAAIGAAAQCIEDLAVENKGAVDRPVTAQRGGKRGVIFGT